MKLDQIGAAVVVVAFVVVTAVIAWWPPPAEGCRAAIGYRDNVPLDQQLGSWAWTLPWLVAGYDEVEIFTATASNDKRADWTDALADAADDNCEVDLYIFAHGDDYASWIEQAPRRPALRLVYDTGAGDARQGHRWIAAGAGAFVGHPGGNIAPVWFGFFLPEWMTGSSVDDATATANAKTRTFIDTFGIDASGRLWRGTKAVGFGDVGMSR
ncbi:MAG: hypothetical protein Q8O67_30200 [Deltaproteobacteria bacterium]|nr:hypothetical protein [Deltaproteobacteria bacterium]